MILAELHDENMLARLDVKGFFFGLRAPMLHVSVCVFTGQQQRSLRHFFAAYFISLLQHPRLMQRTRLAISKSYLPDFFHALDDVTAGVWLALPLAVLGDLVVAPLFASRD